MNEDELAKPPQRIFLKIPPPNMAAPLRRSSRHRTASDSAGPSGSEYHDSDKSVHEPVEQEDEEEQEQEVTLTSRGRRVKVMSYVESAESNDEEDPVELFKSDENVARASHADDENEEEDQQVRYPTRRKKPPHDSFIVPDDEDNKTTGTYSLRSRSKPKKPSSRSNGISSATAPRSKGPSMRARRLSRRNAARQQEEADVYVQHTSSAASNESFDDAPHMSSDDLEMDAEGEPEEPMEQEPEGDGKPYSLRQRQKINYAIPPPLEEMSKPPPKPNKSGGGGRSGWHGGKSKGKGLGWSASGAELGRWMGMTGDDSVSFSSCFPRWIFLTW